ncbi:hypothetical protein EMPG_09558 [Blastomyces silverae]|uniref:DUF4219 domain-containing protein n=1 Tax=Blastomyces silverae TaxID=2060906 RepID=A0A0H1BLB3_9EURO|nr:hypothetical protein EMPG_09558 [Blastomyces silverae]
MADQAHSRPRVDRSNDEERQRGPSSPSPPRAFESSIIEPPETPSRHADLGLATAPPTTVRPARTSRRLGVADPTPLDDDSSATPGSVSEEYKLKKMEFKMEFEKIELERMELRKQMELEKMKREKQMEEYRELKRQLRIQELRDAPGHPPEPTQSLVACPSPAWDHDIGSKLRYNLYDPDSWVGKAIRQFKEESKYITKPNALKGMSNYITWSASMKSKLRQAQCWVIIEEQQTQSPVRDPEWAPFWVEQNRWLYAFILSSLSAAIRPWFDKKVDDRIAYTLWCEIEARYSLPKTQLRREAVLEFISLSGTQVTNPLVFFDKFRAAIMKLEMMNATPPDAWVFDIFYSALPNVWRHYVQMKIEDVQVSKSDAVILDVHRIMEEIRFRLDRPKGS